MQLFSLCVYRYNSNPLVTRVNRIGNSLIVNNLIEMENRSQNISSAERLNILFFTFKDNNIFFRSDFYSWEFIIEKMKTIHPKLEPRFKFHYYSRHGVCLPNYYPDPETDFSFGFTCFVVIINVLCFVGISVMYICIYGYVF